MNEAEKIITNTIICTICGGAGHVPSDCKFRKNADGSYAELNPDGSLMISGVNRVEQQKLDVEVSCYASTPDSYPRLVLLCSINH